jgi:hypothetical protein
MTAHSTIADLNMIPDAQPTVAETPQLEPTSLLQRIEVWLDKAFGGDAETIANSLRGL